MTTIMIQYLNKETFDKTIKDKDVVLVDFYADWCGPCLAMNPVLEDLSSELNGKATIAKVNVDDQPLLAAEFNVRSIPSLFFFKQGDLVAATGGFQPKEVLGNRLRDLIEN